MCGISMILDFNATPKAGHIQQMMGAIQHRGPDAENYVDRSYDTGRIFLGTNRLKIIDEDNNSNQPFISTDGRYGLIYNGEIYNYENLRNQLLALRVQFTTRSDTEVLLYWLIHKGQNGVADLQGMFAFVFVDFIKSEVISARDGLGIKPLYIHRTNKLVIFSSEIQGILASGLAPKELNEDAVLYYLSYKYAPRPATFYKEIEEVMPGSIYKIDAAGKLESSVFTQKLKPVGSDINDLLIDSVIQQYSEARNTGVMLSGGVDSTLLLAILNKELGYRNIPTFTLCLKEKNKFSTEDGSFALKAAKVFEAQHTEIGIDESSFDLIEEYIPTLGQPIADSGGFLTWLIAQKASQKSKVLLSGAGADELFAGYNRHQAFYKYLKHRDKNWFRLLKHGKNMPSYSLFLRQFTKFANSINSDPSTTFNNFIQSDTFRMSKDLWDDLSSTPHLKKALEHDQKNYLGADVLNITDQATMQHSIEARVPYLDNNLVQAARNLSVEKLFQSGPKWMLKEKLIKYGGQQFANRKKQGLGLPMDDWFRKNDHWFNFNLHKNKIHQFVSQKTIQELVSRHRSGSENLTQELWRILLLHKWLKHNFT